MFEASILITFIVAVAVLCVTPGPDMALLVSRGVGQGWKAAWFTVIGFALAGLLQIPLLALGVASLVQSSPLAFDILRCLGAAYLIWRGARLIWKARAAALQDVAGTTTPAQAVRDGVIASLTNPKGLIFLLAFLPQFVDPGRGSVTLQLIVLGLVMKAVALVIESAIALGSGAVGGWLSRWPGIVAWQERLTGAVLIGLGFRLLTMGDGRAR